MWKPNKNLLRPVRVGHSLIQLSKTDIALLESSLAVMWKFLIGNPHLSSYLKDHKTIF